MVAGFARQPRHHFLLLSAVGARPRIIHEIPGPGGEIHCNYLTRDGIVKCGFGGKGRMKTEGSVCQLIFAMYMKRRYR